MYCDRCKQEVRNITVHVRHQHSNYNQLWREYNPYKTKQDYDLFRLAVDRLLFRRREPYVFLTLTLVKREMVVIKKIIKYGGVQ